MKTYTVVSSGVGRTTETVPAYTVQSHIHPGALAEAELARTACDLADANRRAALAEARVARLEEALRHIENNADVRIRPDMALRQMGLIAHAEAAKQKQEVSDAE